MKRAGVAGLLILLIVLTSVQGSPIASALLNWSLALLFIWLLVKWRRRRPTHQRRSTPTAYGNVVFRSRTEAAWAERFDREGLEWRYEPRRFKLKPEGRHLGYLPDFELADGSFVEIKGVSPTEEEQWKCQQVADITCHDVVLLAGWPGKHSTHTFAPRSRSVRNSA